TFVRHAAVTFPLPSTARRGPQAWPSSNERVVGELQAPPGRRVGARTTRLPCSVSSQPIAVTPPSPTATSGPATAPAAVASVTGDSHRPRLPMTAWTFESCSQISAVTPARLPAVSLPKMLEKPAPTAMSLGAVHEPAAG